jgi:hypothetical protein
MSESVIDQNMKTSEQTDWLPVDLAYFPPPPPPVRSNLPRTVLDEITIIATKQYHADSIRRAV